jgi:hypothetical protein
MPQKTSIKKEKVLEKPKIKKRYMLSVDGIAPIKAQFETWAFDEHEALEQFKNPRLMNLVNRPDIDLSRLKLKKITVKDIFTQLIKLTKSF